MSLFHRRSQKYKDMQKHVNCIIGVLKLLYQTLFDSVLGGENKLGKFSQMTAEDLSKISNALVS